MTHVQGDAADAETIKALVDRVVKERGRLDFFFANAGIVGAKKGQGSLPRGLDETEGDEFTEVMRVNALGYALAIQDFDWRWRCIADPCRPFLALKYGAPALGITDPSKGKSIPGGSIVLTASGESFP